MSLMGQTRPIGDGRAMSASHPTATKSLRRIMRGTALAQDLCFLAALKYAVPAYMRPIVYTCRDR